MTPIIEVRSLQKAFGAVTAAKDVSAQFYDEEVVGIIGANGAGKTTLVNMITGYLKPDAGQIFYRGNDITGLAPRYITQLGICRSFQVAQLFTSLSVEDNLLIALGVGRSGGSVLHPLRSANRLSACSDVIERFGLSEYQHKPAHTLPAGLRKIVDVAMATVSQPSVLLLDEPTSSISADEKLELMERLMSALGQQRLSVLFIEHDMDVVRRYSSRVLAFYSGAIIKDGPCDEVFGDPLVKEVIVGADRRELNE